jgi:flagellar hook-associated protein 3 FlgL
MRISTHSIQQQSISAILQQQSALAKTQQQVASGKRVISAGDDPVAAVQLQALTRLQGQQSQYGKNSDAAQNRLQLEEQGLADSTTVLQRIRDLTLQANSATTTNADRQYIATEVRSRIEELQGIANRKDNNGDFLFSGYTAGVKPFAQDAAGHVTYAGDSGQRSVMIDSTVAVADGDSGARVFGGIKAGNGLFTTAAAAGNTGSGSIDTGAIVNRGGWSNDTYTLSFTDATHWQVTDSASNAVASGTYVSGGAIAFRGVQVSVSGTPAAGDSFQVRSATTTDMFSSLEQLASTLNGTADTDAAHAQLNTKLGSALQQIDQSLDHVSSVRSDVGTRLALIDDVSGTRDSRLADVATSISQLQDLDYASAISKMNQQYLGLQASQQAYVKVAGLSLFNYL